MMVLCEKFIPPRLGRLGDFPFDRSAPYASVRTDSAVSRTRRTGNRPRFQCDNLGRTDRELQGCPDGAAIVRTTVDLCGHDLQNGQARCAPKSSHWLLGAILSCYDRTMGEGTWRLESMGSASSISAAAHESGRPLSRPIGDYAFVAHASITINTVLIQQKWP
jgi:hypothetical protein